MSAPDFAKLWQQYRSRYQSKLDPQNWINGFNAAARPENAKGTIAYAKPEDAMKQKPKPGQVLFIYAKQGYWKNKRPPTANANGEVPVSSISNDDNHYNYVIYFNKDGGTWVWMNIAYPNKDNIPQKVYLGSDPPNYPEYPNTIYLVTPVPVAK
jgi:hypothetical protein